MNKLPMSFCSQTNKSPLNEVQFCLFRRTPKTLWNDMMPLSDVLRRLSYWQRATLWKLKKTSGRSMFGNRLPITFLDLFQTFFETSPKHQNRLISHTCSVEVSIDRICPLLKNASAPHMSLAILIEHITH